MEDQKKEDVVVEQWVNMGVVFDDGKKYQSWVRIQSPEKSIKTNTIYGQSINDWKGSLQVNKPLLFSKNLTSNNPGVVYNVNVKYKEGGRVSVSGTPSYVGMWHSSQDRIQWRLESSANEMKEALYRAEKKSKETDPVKEHLAPLKAILDKQVGQNRTIMAARIIQYLFS